jgi:ATP-dependent DNA helicase RecQ
MVSEEQIGDALRRYWGYDAFRPKQEEIVRNILGGRDVCVVMPTGGGKSLCYQLPAALQTGRTAIVVSPLISLMQDQVAQLAQMGIPAAVLNSSQSFKEQRETGRRAEDGEFRLLYLSPERLAKQEMLEWLEKFPLSFFAIDEAHCISEWGHEFRPDYRELKLLRKKFPDRPIAAFTASATRRVRHDIIEQLKLRDPGKFIASFHRKNLNYQVVACDSKTQEAKLLAILRKHKGSAAIVYSPTIKRVASTVAMLRGEGITAVGYHADMDSTERKENQECWMADEVNVLVGTVAFGLGINKSAVRAVVHLSLPKSIEQYYQEAGRAGRDGRPSDCFLLWQRKDAGLLAYFIEQISDPAEKRRSWDRYHEVRGFAESDQCRHKIICNHFGEKVAWTNCGACDACLPAMEWNTGGRKQRPPAKKNRLEKKPSAIAEPREINESLLAALKQWRLERARADRVPAFVILHDATLEHLSVTRPRTMPELRRIPGIGDVKLERYGAEILDALRKEALAQPARS